MWKQNVYIHKESKQVFIKLKDVFMKCNRKVLEWHEKKLRDLLRGRKVQNKNENNWILHWNISADNKDFAY